MKRYLILALALILLGGQAAVVGIAIFKPHVSLQYRAFFIDRSSTIWNSTPGS